MTDAVARGGLLVFDSGLGGLTVLKEIAKVMPGADLTYVADTAGFPYGALTGEAVAGRVVAVMEHLIPKVRPTLAVIACNTASTLALPKLRASFDCPFVGTVPAIKPAAEQTRSGLISVLATPGTAARDYTKELIREFASACEVTLVGAPNLAGLAERKLIEGSVDGDAIAREVAPAFVAAGDRRTDTIVLACTHYPLLLDELKRAAPWPVTWVDPAPAIARRVQCLARELGGHVEAGSTLRRVIVTERPRDPASFATAVGQFGLPAPELVDLPFPRRAVAV